MEHGFSKDQKQHSIDIRVAHKNDECSDNVPGNGRLKQLLDLVQGLGIG